MQTEPGRSCSTVSTRDGRTMNENFYFRGAHYDAQHEHVTPDVVFFRGIAREIGGPILEVACGTGRIAIPLLDDGHAVTGLDIEREMLDRAIEKTGRKGSFLLGDMRGMQLGRRFRLVIIAFNSLGHLHAAEDVRRFFARVHEHLDDGGRFVLSMFNPDLRMLSRKPNDTREISRYRDPESTGEVVVTETATYDRANQLLQSTWHYRIGDRAFDTQLRLRIFFPQELDALVRQAGFSIAAKYGNFDRSPFTSDSPHQIIVAARP
jgi:SAM-dependent methyltransferase